MIGQECAFVGNVGKCGEILSLQTSLCFSLYLRILLFVVILIGMHCSY